MSTHVLACRRNLQEGAVEAILKLCKTDNLLVRGYCSAAVKRFAATPVLREKVVARGGVSGSITNVSFLSNFMPAQVFITSDAQVMKTNANAVEICYKQAPSTGS